MNMNIASYSNAIYICIYIYIYMRVIDITEWLKKSNM